MQVFDIGKDSKPPITGLEFRRVPNSLKYIIILTTLIRIYQYIGIVSNNEEKPLLQQVFNKYLNIKGTRLFIVHSKLYVCDSFLILERFNQLESSLPYSKMQLYYTSIQEFPKMFSWLTETGLLVAQVRFMKKTLIIFIIN